MALIPRKDLNKYFVLAVKQIELRGYVWADSKFNAMKYAREYWTIYDDKGNTISSGTTNSSYTPAPLIAETDRKIKIIHVEDADTDKQIVKFVCPACGAKKNMHCIRMEGLNKGMPLPGFHLERIMKVIDVNERIKKIVEGTKWG